MKTLYHNYFFIFITTFALFFLSCGNKKAENAITEGIIDYKTDVINNKHPLASFAPSSACVKIKDNRWMVEMSTMGLFNVYFSCDLDKATLTEMIKYMDIKIACVENDSMLKEENNKYLLTFKETNETKEIAGYKCKKIIATKVSKPTESFDVYYTTDIGPESSNAHTPYKSIKGTLMDYRIVRLGLEMHFVAKTAKSAEIKDSDFDVPENFKKISRKEFDAEFDKLFADFF